MIFTKVRIKNLYCFEDTELDLTYQKKNIDSVIEHEYLDERAPNFRFKRLCIISGANASGKTSFGKVLCDISNILDKGKSFAEKNDWNISDDSKRAEIDVEFVDPLGKELKLRRLIFNIENGIYTFTYAEVPINKSDSVETCRERSEELLNKKISRGKYIYLENKERESYLDKWDELEKILFKDRNNTIWVYDISHISSSNDIKKNYIDCTNKGYTKTLSNVLRTFDPSIERVTELFEFDGDKELVVKGYTIHFPNKKYCTMDAEGRLDPRYDFLFSRGTYQAISVAGFTHSLIKNMTRTDKLVSGTYFLDEQMSYSHTDLEREMVNLLAQKTNKYSQFFYTTHNHDIYEMSFPKHSFVFIYRERGRGNPKFEWADTVCNKNDRSISTYVRNNYFNTNPEVDLLDEILWED